MARRLYGALLMIAAAGVAGCGQANSETAKPPAAAEPLVVYDLPVTHEVTDYEDFPGRTDAIFSVEVRARVSGYLDRVYFQDGMNVSKGDVLFQIDQRPFKATLDRTKAALEQAEAHAKRLSNEYKRAQVLYDRGLSISREEYDRYAFDHAEAEAALGTARANIDLAALDLEFTRVVAPISGRLSRRMVDPGNLVKADETALTSIVTQDPIYVYFDVHEQAMLKIRRLIEQRKVGAKSEKEVIVKISLSDEKDSEGRDIFTHQGTVDFTENRVDLNTGTLRFRAKMDNPGEMITPGLYVKVRLPIGDAHPALMVREQALQSDQSQKKVFVLRDSNEKGEPYFIKDAKGEVQKDRDGKPITAFRPEAVDVGTIGVLRDGYREITRGVKPGDKVVTVGMQKIRLGKNPVTGEPNLVKARPFDPEKDSTLRAAAPAAGPLQAPALSPVSPESPGTPVTKAMPAPASRGPRSGRPGR
jgi:multidrug efflux system membrane fusion protein